MYLTIVRILKFDESNVHALYNRAVSFDKLGRYKDAIRDFDSVLNLDPTNANAYFNRGSAYDSVPFFLVKKTLSIIFN